MVGQHAGDLPRMDTRGDVGAPALPCSLAPSQPTGTWRWTSSPGRPSGQRGAAACAPAKRRPGCRRRSCQPRTTNLRPSLPRQARFGQQRPRRSPAAATRRTRCANPSRSRRTDLRDPAWCGQRGRSGRGHRTPGCPDTWITPVVWTPVAWTADAWTPGCPPDQLDGRPSARRTADADSATNGVTGVKTSWTATTTAMPAGRPKPGSGCGVCGARTP
jgi:hypothetical protein